MEELKKKKLELLALKVTPPRTPQASPPSARPSTAPSTPASVCGAAGSDSDGEAMWAMGLLENRMPTGKGSNFGAKKMVKTEQDGLQFSDEKNKHIRHAELLNSYHMLVRASMIDICCNTRDKSNYLARATFVRRSPKMTRGV